MHDDSILILLMLAAFALNIAVWIIKDMDRINKEQEEIEHWLEHGENNGK